MPGGRDLWSLGPWSVEYCRGGRVSDDLRSLIGQDWYELDGVVTVVSRSLKKTEVSLL